MMKRARQRRRPDLLMFSGWVGVLFVATHRPNCHGWVGAGGGAGIGGMFTRRSLFPAPTLPAPTASAPGSTTSASWGGSACSGRTRDMTGRVILGSRGSGSMADNGGGGGGGSGDDDDDERNGNGAMKLVGENLERQTYVYEVRLTSPLGIKLAEEQAGYEMEGAQRGPATYVVVQSLVPGASADRAGMRKGDRIVATGAAIGGAMWEKTTLDGVTAAVQSRVRFGAVALRIERPFDNSDEVSWRSVVSETIKVEVSKPLGMALEERGRGDDRAVFVKQVEPSGNCAGKLKEGDRIVAVSASFGDGMWGSTTVEGVTSAITTRIGSTVKLTIERQVRVGSWGNEADVGYLDYDEGGADDYDLDSVAGGEEDEAEARGDAEEGEGAQAKGEGQDDVDNGIGSAIETLEELQRTKGLTTNSTRAVLLERCCATLNRYGYLRGPEAVSKIDEVVAVLFKARVRPSSKFVNMGMTAYLRKRHPGRAVALYDGALALGFTPNMQVVTTLLRAVTPGSGAAPEASGSGGKGSGGKGGWPTEDASSPSSAVSSSPRSSSSGDPLQRVMAAMEMLEQRKVLPDTYLLNQLMRAYTLVGQYSRAEDVFYRVLKAGGASQAEAKARPCPPDVVSWNIMIDCYARQGKPELARRCFQDMQEQTSDMIRPDKFTYTALIKSYIKVDDFAAAEQVLEDMEQRAAAYTASLRGETPDDLENEASSSSSSSSSSFTAALPPPTPDVFLYNTLIEGFSRSLRWREAEATLDRMRSRGLQPNADTFTSLVPCLIRAQHPNIALEKLEELRELGIPLNTALYTMFITAHARRGDAVAALGLLREMKNERVPVTVRTFSAAMDACLRANNPDLALALSAEMKRGGIEPDEIVYTMIVRAYGLKGEVRKAALLCASLQREAADADALEAGGSGAARPSPVVRPTHVLYDALLKEAVLRSSWAIAIGALSEVILRFYPSDATYSAVCGEPLEDTTASGESGADNASMHSMRSRFLFEAVNRIKDSPNPKVRQAGNLYATCLSVALADGSDAASDAAVSLVESRRRGELRLRQRDEQMVVEAERPWISHLGKAFSSEWDTVKLFEEIQ